MRDELSGGRSNFRPSNPSVGVKNQVSERGRPESAAYASLAACAYALWKWNLLAKHLCETKRWRARLTLCTRKVKNGRLRHHVSSRLRPGRRSLLLLCRLVRSSSRERKSLLLPSAKKYQKRCRRHRGFSSERSAKPLHDPLVKCGCRAWPAGRRSRMDSATAMSALQCPRGASPEEAIRNEHLDSAYEHQPRRTGVDKS